MINFTSRTKYFINARPTDMRKGCEGLAEVVRTYMGHNPLDYNEAFIFYSKDYRKVKILHFDINGWVLYSKWFTEGKFLKPAFEECKKSHELSRELLILLLSTAVRTKIAI
jgi:transposase